MIGAILLAASLVTVEKPYFRWLFNGFGFQNSEANFLRVMPDDFRDQRVLKTFRELSPSFARVYTGFADQDKADLDVFADYYDLTFRDAETTLYAVPCAMPAFPEKINAEEYAEKVALNLKYLIRERNCRKIRYYCLTNEMMAGDRWRYFFNEKDKTDEKPQLFKKFYEALFFAFRRHGLDIRLLASDEAATTKPEVVFPFMDWIKQNMNDYVGAYCSHWYVYGRRTDELCLWNEYNAYFSNLVQRALGCANKRFILGEYGFHPAWGKPGVMQDDVSYHRRQPETRCESVLCKCEIGLAAMNQGAAACVDWSFVDYPDPYVIEDGDTPEEHALYVAGKCGYRIDGKYNKCGVFKWETVDHDYSSYEELYAMGWLVKLFRKNATVLPVKTADEMLRCGAVFNPDRSVSIAIINRGSAREAVVDCSSWQARKDGRPSLHKPLRRYVYDSANVPFNAFNDLQPMSGTVKAAGDRFTVSLPAKSMTFLTTDYEDVVPAAIGNVRIEGGNIVWDAAKSSDHRYYRVYRDGVQIASTVATKLRMPSTGCASSKYVVTSVDRWNNEGAR